MNFGSVTRVCLFLCVSVVLNLFTYKCLSGNMFSFRNASFSYILCLSNVFCLVICMFMRLFRGRIRVYIVYCQTLVRTWIALFLAYLNLQTFTDVHEAICFCWLQFPFPVEIFGLFSTLLAAEVKKPDWTCSFVWISAKEG